jgi:hypothetical protein
LILSFYLFRSASHHVFVGYRRLSATFVTIKLLSGLSKFADVQLQTCHLVAETVNCAFAIEVQALEQASIRGRQSVR